MSGRGFVRFVGEIMVVMRCEGRELRVFGEGWRWWVGAYSFRDHRLLFLRSHEMGKDVGCQSELRI